MTKQAFEGLKAVIERMVVDDGFKQAVLANPEAAISAAGIEVSAEELVALKNLTAADLDGLTPELVDERLSKSAGIICELTVYTENIKS